MPGPPPRTPFRIERLMRPASVAVIGAAGAQVLANLWASPFQGTIAAAEDAADLAATPDLAVIATEADRVAPTLAVLGARKCAAAVVLGPAPDVGAAARSSGVRVLGPDSFGVAVPAIGLNATRAHLPVPAGGLALVSQSSSLCRTVIDWAAPNGVGFSHVIGIGGNEDIGFRAVLDWLAHDRDTKAILLDLRRLKHRSAFLSAVRAASRNRPVVAIRPGARLADPSGLAELAFAAALRRAGALSVDSVEALLAAAETLTRAPPLQREGLVILTNSGSLGRLMGDAAERDGVALARLSDTTRAALASLLPAPPDGALLWAPPGFLPPVQAIADVLAHDAGGLMVVLAPSGAGDGAVVAALAAARSKLPLLACVMGEVSAEAHRRTIAAAGLPVFAGPEQAMRGFRHLLASRRSRIAARELPPRDVLALSPDLARAAEVIGAVRGAGRRELTGDEAGTLLGLYGITVGGPAEPDLTLAVADDAMFGPVIVLTTRSGRRAADLPPLNLPLARALLAASCAEDALAETLVRVSQLIVDQPAIGRLTLGFSGLAVVGAGLCLRAALPGDDQPLLAIRPYPTGLIDRFVAGVETFTIRPIRPEDAEAHAAFFRRLSPEDIRYRFFSLMRELSAEQTARMTQVDYLREIAFIAVRDTTGETVGVSRLVNDGREGTSEFAVIVQPDVKGKGLAGVLMQRLIDWGRSQGLAEINGLVLADNHPMLGFIRRLGFALRRVPDEPDLVQAVLKL